MSDPIRSDEAGGSARAWPIGSGPGPSAGVQATMSQMTERLQTVIDAAERAADAIRLDAHEQARRHLAESQRKADRMTAERVRLISELTDDLVRHAGTVRDHSEGMVGALEEAIASVTEKLELTSTNPPPPNGDRDQGVPVAVSSGRPAGAGSPAHSSFATSEELGGGAAALGHHTRESGVTGAPEQEPIPREALLYATRLAVAGSDREQIELALERELGVPEPERIVDRVLGTR